MLGASSCTSDFSTQSERSEAVLVQCAISDREVFDVSLYADIVKVGKRKQPMSGSHIASAKTFRGVVKTFSQRSRKRMLEKLAMLRDCSGGYFVTLTYPGRFMWTAAEVKRHIHTFSKALLRRFPECGAFWRMELKERLSGESRGLIVPHFHLLLFGAHAPSLAYMRRWIKTTWSRIVAYPDSERRMVRTQCDVINSRRHAANYASKYAAKCEDSTLVLFQDENSDTWGRHWGTFGNLDLDQVMSVSLDQEQLIRFKRLVRCWLKSRGSAYAKRLAHIREDFGFSAFGLGDLSPGGGGALFECTAMRMLLSCSD